MWNLFKRAEEKKSPVTEQYSPGTVKCRVCGTVYRNENAHLVGCVLIKPSPCPNCGYNGKLHTP